MISLANRVRPICLVIPPLAAPTLMRHRLRGTAGSPTLPSSRGFTRTSHCTWLGSRGELLPCIGGLS